jgi:hypothetical protein
MNNINKYESLVAGQKTRQRLKQLAYSLSQRSINCITLFSIVSLFLFLNSCKKLIATGEPINSITTTEVFSTDLQANTAFAGIYAYMNQTGWSFHNGIATVYMGLSSDDIFNFQGSSSTSDYQFFTNTLLSNNYQVQNYFWTNTYFSIYQANAALSGLAISTGLHDSVRNELTGEAKFVRAFNYFYLVNIFGDVPLALTTDYNNTYLLPRTPAAQIYQQIIADLIDAQTLLKTDYSYSLAKGERIIPNKWAATALLARVYLFTGDYQDAVTQATSIINNSTTYALVSGLKSVFNANSSEAIWQLKQNNTASGYNGTEDGAQFVPSTGGSPHYPITNTLLQAFEPGDIRDSIWIDSTKYLGTEYYYPYKYTLGPSQATVGGSIPQYYMMLRFSEQYLIRAEAEARSSDLTDAITDLNKIRQRANLLPYSGSTTDPNAVLTSIQHEWQVEFFAEWGHRWLDLKRWGLAPTVLSANKGFTVSSSSLLYPIPSTELTTDPNLVQNPGYQ